MRWRQLAKQASLQYQRTQPPCPTWMPINLRTIQTDSLQAIKGKIKPCIAVTYASYPIAAQDSLSMKTTSPTKPLSIQKTTKGARTGLTGPLSLGRRTELKGPLNTGAMTGMTGPLSTAGTQCLGEGRTPDCHGLTMDSLEDRSRLEHEMLSDCSE